MSVLITAANSSKAHQLKNKLTGENIILGDYLELPDFMLKTGKMIQLPNPQSNSYTHQMLALCLDNGINRVYALNSQEFDLLTESQQLFSEYGIKIKISENDL